MQNKKEIARTALHTKLSDRSGKEDKKPIKFTKKNGYFIKMF